MPVLEGKVGLSGDAFFAWDVESVYGTATTFEAADSGAFFLSESMAGVVNIRTVDNISSAFRDINQVYVGSEIVAGDVQFAVPYDGIEELLVHAFGVVASPAGTSGTFDLTYDLTSTGRYKISTSAGPSLSIYVCRGVVGSGNTNNGIFTYAGCVVDQMVLSCTRDGPLLLTLSFFGKSEAFANINASPTFVNAPVANGTDCAVTWGGTAIPVTDFTLTMRRNIDRERFFLGQTQTAEPPMGQYEVTCDVGSEWDNETRAGSTTMRADYTAQTARALNFLFTGANVTGTSQPRTFNLQMPQAVITAFPPNVSSVGRVLVPMSFTGFDQSVGTIPHEVRLLNTVDTDFNDV